METKLRALSAGAVEASALLTLALIPVLVDFYSFRVFEPDKHAVFFALAVVAGLAGAVALIEGRLAGWRMAIRRPLVAAALLLGLAWTVATATSIVPRVSFYGSHERAQGLVGLVAALVLFATVAWVARTRARRRRLVAATIVGSVPVAVMAVVQALDIEVVSGVVESRARVFGTLSNPIFLGAYLMLVAPFTVARLAAAWRDRRLGMATGLVGLLALQLVALLLSDSRGPILGLVVGLWVMALAGAVLAGRRRLGWGLVILAVTGALLLAVFNLPDSPLAPLRQVRFIGRFGQISQTATGSEAARVRMWGAVNRLLAAEPERLVTGRGPEALKYALLPYAEANLPGRAQADRLVDRGHNVLLDALVMTGLPGALALLLVYGAWLTTAAGVLGLVPQRRHLRLAGLLVVGTALGAATWLVWPVYAAALTLLGMVGGLVAYLLLALWQRPAPSRLDFTALALLGIGAAAVVEAAFGIQTVVTQAVFWIAAGLLVGQAGAASSTAPAAPKAAKPSPGRRRGGSAGEFTVSWSAGGAALGLAVGAAMSALVFGFFIYGIERLPDTAPVVLLTVLLTWLAGAFLAADSGESGFACATTGLLAALAYVGLRLAVLAWSHSAVTLWAATVWWVVALAVVAALWLRATARGAPFWVGPAGVVYPLLAVGAVALVFVRAVLPVQADIYFQSASANLAAAMASDDPQRFKDGEELFERARRLNPREPVYLSKWAEFYTRLGASLLAGPQPDLQAAASAFDRAQKLVLAAEQLEPQMPYHTFNRGHVQLVLAQGLPQGAGPLSREQVAANAAAAFAQAFQVLRHDPQVANEYALARLLEGKTGEAIALLQYSLSVDPDHPETRVLLGRAYLADGQVEQARLTLEEALEKGATGPDVLVSLGEVARQQGETFQALNYYRQASAEDPDNWALLYNLGLLYGETGDTTQALDVLMEAMAKAPSAERARVQAAVDALLTGEGQAQAAPSEEGGAPAPAAAPVTP